MSFRGRGGRGGFRGGGRGRGRGGGNFQQRDFGPPEHVMGKLPAGITQSLCNATEHVRIWDI